jgi:hypothetical protein
LAPRSLLRHLQAVRCPLRDGRVACIGRRITIEGLSAKGGSMTRGGFASALFLALVLLALCPVAVLAALSLNEIMADPATDWNGDGVYDFKNDEWVELYNTGPGSLDLGDYGLSDETGYRTYGFEPATTLGAGQAIVIYGSQSVAWQEENGVSQYGFKMSNDGDTVVLWRYAAGDTVMVDTRVFNTYEAEDDRSTGRTPDGTGEWQIFDSLNPYEGTVPPLGNDLPPTPGHPNAGGDPPIDALFGTWGRMKSLFR